LQVASSNTACGIVNLVHSAAVCRDKQVLRHDIPLLQAFGHWLLPCNLNLQKRLSGLRAHCCWLLPVARILSLFSQHHYWDTWPDKQQQEQWILPAGKL
jgi:hypothetical protein